MEVEAPLEEGGEEEVEAHMQLGLEAIVSVLTVVRPFHIKLEFHAIKQNVPVVELLWSDNKIELLKTLKKKNFSFFLSYFYYRYLFE